MQNLRKFVGQKQSVFHHVLGRDFKPRVDVGYSITSPQTSRSMHDRLDLFAQ
jgi:hypothetical protein